jgi:hypothetical protein
VPDDLRLHLDFRPDDQDAEVVLADPEGNEFCVLGQSPD